jgi:hypothetical protein
MEDQQQQELRYWLCCGSCDHAHRPACLEAKSGHPERCRFGTAAEHSAWQKTLIAASPSSSVLERARESLRELVTLEADGMQAGESAIEAWERARSALAEIDRTLGGAAMSPHDDGGRG